MSDASDESNIRERRYEVDQNFDGWRLDRFLSNRMARLSRSRAGEIAKFGDIEIFPQRKVKAGTKLRNGDVVIVREHLPPETVQDDEVQVLYSDDDICVLNKPARMLVHEAAHTRMNTIQGYLHRSGFHEAEPTHRLDRDTSGVLICAKKKQWIPVLRETFAKDHPQKIYRALVLDPDRIWKPEARQTIRVPLGLDPESVVGVRMTRGNLPSTTHVHVVGRQDDLADLEIQIETGRQHQIRVHLAMQGTPIAGDKLYTFDDEFFMNITDHPNDPELLSQLTFPRHALHAWKLQIKHPATKEEMMFEAPLPEMFR